MKSKSQFICRRCGLAVYSWMGADNTTVWKHATGGRGAKSCGKPPVVVDRAQAEAEDAQFYQDAVAALNGRIDPT